MIIKLMSSNVYQIQVELNRTLTDINEVDNFVKMFECGGLYTPTSSEIHDELIMAPLDAGKEAYDLAREKVGDDASILLLDIINISCGYVVVFSINTAEKNAAPVEIKEAKMPATWENDNTGTTYNWDFSTPEAFTVGRFEYLHAMFWRILRNEAADAESDVIGSALLNLLYPTDRNIALAFESQVKELNPVVANLLDTFVSPDGIRVSFKCQHRSRQIIDCLDLSPTYVITLDGIATPFMNEAAICEFVCVFENGVVGDFKPMDDPNYQTLQAHHAAKAVAEENYGKYSEVVFLNTFVKEGHRVVLYSVNTIEHNSSPVSVPNPEMDKVLAPTVKAIDVYNTSFVLKSPFSITKRQRDYLTARINELIADPEKPVPDFDIKPVMLTSLHANFYEYDLHTEWLLRELMTPNMWVIFTLVLSSWASVKRTQPMRLKPLQDSTEGMCYKFVAL